jgi:hypothetical protein
MSAQEKIKLYLKAISKGAVCISDQHANHIVNLALESPNVVEVQKYRYNGNDNKYELMHTFFMEKEVAEAKIHKLRPVKQWHYFFQFKIPELEFTHYTVNNNLLP